MKYVQAELLKRACVKESLHGPADFLFAGLSVRSSDTSTQRFYSNPLSFEETSGSIPLVSKCK